MEYEITKLIIEGIAIVVLYIITMIVLIAVKKEAWVHEYPDKVREAYLAGRQDATEAGKTKRYYFWKLFVKKTIALGIYIAVMLAVTQTVEYKEVFLTENFIACFIIWPVVTLIEALLLDVLFIGHWKKIRLPGTELLHDGYKGIYIKALKDALQGLAFGVIVLVVLFGITKVAWRMTLNEINQDRARHERELAELRKESADLQERKAILETINDAKEKADEKADEWLESVKEFMEETEHFEEEDSRSQDFNAGCKLVRERPVLEGESLWSIAEGIYGDPYKWTELYEANKDVIGEDAGLLFKGQFLQIPEQDNDYNRYFYTDYETCYQDATAEEFVWEGIEPYIDPDCGYEIQTVMFYYTFPEGEGEQFKICYPRLVAHNGKDVSAVNAGIRERAMRMTDELLINRSDELKDNLLHDDRYSTKWTRSTVDYVITYLDEDVISVVFQEYTFTGSIYGEYIALRSYVGDINTGMRYKNADLLQGTDDMQLANLLFDDMIAQHEDSEFETRLFEVVLTPQLIAETLKTNLMIDGRHFMNLFLTEDGVGFALSYRVGEDVDGSYSIMRGWTKTILDKEQVEAYRADSSVWRYWE